MPFSSDMFEMLPIAVRVESKSKIKLALFMAALKGMLDTSAPDLVRWERRKHGTRSYVAVIGDEEEAGTSFTIFYATMAKALLVSLDEDILKRAIDRELAPLTAKNIQNLPKARHLLLESSNRFLIDSSKIMDDISFEDKRMRESWKALPILNAWHRHFPDADPVQFHKKSFASDLHCPGGKGYRWNAEAMTMESIAYGHPSAPRHEPNDLHALKNFPSITAAMGFEDGGLRVRASMGAPSKRVTAASPEKNIPAIKLATIEEITPLKVGASMTYKQVGAPENTEIIQSKILKVEKTDQGTRVERQLLYTDEEGKTFPSTRVELIKDGLRSLRIDSPDSSTIYNPGYLQFPPELVQGKSYQETYKGIIKPKENKKGEPKDMDEQHVFGQSTTTATGGQTVKTPTGTYENCIRVSTRSHHLYGAESGVTSQTLVSWYKKDIGLVKFSSTVMGATRVFELTEIKE